MKKWVLFTVFLILAGLLCFSQETWNQNEYEFVKWRMPDDWEEMGNIYLPGKGYYNGVLSEEGDFIEQGSMFAVLVDERLSSALIPEMKSDQGTTLQEEYSDIVNGLKRNVYEGEITMGNTTMGFFMWHFPLENRTDEREAALLGVSSEQDSDGYMKTLREIFSTVIIEPSAQKAEKKIIPVKPELNLDYAVFNPGEPIEVEFQDAPAQTEQDWIGLYKLGTGDEAYLSWQYLNGREEGRLDFKAPDDPGYYTFRLFENNSYNRLAESEIVTVLDVVTEDTNKEEEMIYISSFDFCTGVEDNMPFGIKNRFSAEDSRIYFWLMLDSYKYAHTAVWEWYSPDGEVFDTVVVDLPSAESRGGEILEDMTLWSGLPVSAIENEEKGIWLVKFFIDDRLVLARQFIFLDE